MSKFLHQELVEHYNINVSKLPAKIREAYWEFQGFLKKERMKVDAVILLKRLDDNLTMGIHDWIHENKNSLNELIKRPEDYFTDFYQALLPKIENKSLDKYDYEYRKEVPGRKLDYELSYCSDTHNGQCSYYDLDRYDAPAYGGFCQFSIKLCIEEETAQPLFYRNERGEQYKVFDYFSPEIKVNEKNRARINLLFQSELRNMTEGNVELKRVPEIKFLVRKLKMSLN